MLLVPTQTHYGVRSDVARRWLIALVGYSDLVIAEVNHLRIALFRSCCARSSSYLRLCSTEQNCCSTMKKPRKYRPVLRTRPNRVRPQKTHRLVIFAKSREVARPAPARQRRKRRHKCTRLQHAMPPSAPPRFGRAHRRRHSV